MKHFACMQISHRHEPREPRSILWSESRVVAISQSVSRVAEIATAAGGVARPRGSDRARGLVRIARSGSQNHKR